jgi:hypothetical protein
MTDALDFALLALALISAWLAGSRHARRREHRRFVHHSLGFTLVAVLAAVALIFYGPQ